MGEVHTDMLCVGATCVTEEQFNSVFNQSAAAGATAGDGQLLEAPAASSASGGSPSADNTSTTTPVESEPITSQPANDNPQPQSTEQSSDDNQPVDDVSEPTSEVVAEPLPISETRQRQPTGRAANGNMIRGVIKVVLLSAALAYATLYTFVKVL